MIIDSQRNFIFIHIPKTAGTSIRSVLRQPTSAPELDISCSRDDSKILAAKNPLTKHESYSDFRKFFATRAGLPFSVVENYFVVAVVREPKSRLQSLHRYLLQHQKKKYPNVPEDINLFARHLADSGANYMKTIRGIKTQYSFVESAPKDRLLIGRFESLSADWLKIARSLGLPTELPALNRTDSTSRVALKLSAESKKIVEDFFKVDFEAFSY